MLGKNLNEKSNYNYRYVKIKSVVLYYYRNISTESIETCTEKKRSKIDCSKGVEKNRKCTE